LKNFTVPVRIVIVIIIYNATNVGVKTIRKNLARKNFKKIIDYQRFLKFFNKNLRHI
jgi:hypothetical protein